jgi:hypothetical protein
MVRLLFYMQKTSLCLFVEGIDLMHADSGELMPSIGKIATSGWALALMT